jgi:hypothetical protein
VVTGFAPTRSVPHLPQLFLSSMPYNEGGINVTRTYLDLEIHPIDGIVAKAFVLLATIP